MATDKVIMWFRSDLRLTDNPALTAASQRGTVLPVYIHDDESPGRVNIGAASRCWLHHSLLSLDTSLEHCLSLYKEDAIDCILRLIEVHDIQAVYWNRCYEPWRTEQDTELKATLKNRGVEVHSYNASLLWEPWVNLKSDGTPYRVFTPFYRKGCLGSVPPREPIPTPENLHVLKSKDSLSIASLELLPTIPWDRSMTALWKIGEYAANHRLQSFIENSVCDYKTQRDFPAREGISKLSTHLHFGEISPNQVWYAVKQLETNDGTDCFLSELGWREFSYSLLYHNPKLPWQNIQIKFDKFPWRDNPEHLRAWQQGLTGVPIVDAGMRELWSTGFMHNRVRMITASYLVKNLMIDWRLGERWFWDCLIDADLASNSASWQWVAGCGADAAPYFRIFNPVIQGEKFDPQGEYIKRWVPELNRLPVKQLFSPWKANSEVLKKAGITLGIDYPRPLVDLKASREQALEAFQQLKPIDANLR